jgi:hypothetical protein
MNRCQNHNLAMNDLRKRYAAKRFYVFEQFSDIDPEDQDSVYKDSLIAWWISGRRYTMTKGWNLKLLAGKMDAQLALRKIIHRTDLVLSRLAAAVDTGMTTALSAHKMDMGEYDFSFNIGDIEDDGEIGLEYTLSVSAEPGKQCWYCSH